MSIKNTIDSKAKSIVTLKKQLYNKSDNLRTVSATYWAELLAFLTCEAGLIILGLLSLVLLPAPVSYAASLAIGITFIIMLCSYVNSQITDKASSAKNLFAAAEQLNTLKRRIIKESEM